jgi:hypothetical protein
MSAMAISSGSGVRPCFLVMAATLALLIIQAQGITRNYHFNVSVHVQYPVN